MNTKDIAGSRAFFEEYADFQGFMVSLLLSLALLFLAREGSITL